VINDITRTTLEFKELPRRPAALSWIGYFGEKNKPSLRLDKVIQRNQRFITFETYNEQPCLLQIGQEYSFIHTWDEGQQEIAHSNPEQWSKEIFKAADMILFKRPDGTSMGREYYDGEDIGDGVVVPGGWGHEHCEMCFKTIAAYEPYEHTGYTDGSQWVCIECYNKYIESGWGKNLVI
jgi:hypothetical protein